MEAMSKVLSIIAYYLSEYDMDASFYYTIKDRQF